MVSIAKTKRLEEQESYLRMVIQQCWSVCEVARQIDIVFFESAVLNLPKLSTALRELNPGAESLFAMQMFFNVLSLPDVHREADLHQGSLHNLCSFLCLRDFVICCVNYGFAYLFVRAEVHQ